MIVTADNCPDTNCWLWQGSISPNGYGRVGRHTYAHRYVYELFVGPIPDGMTIDHLCRVRQCVNPAHLEAVSFRENVLRGESPSAVQARQTHCIHGHPFDEVNTYRRPDNGARMCRACSRERDRRRSRAGHR